MSELDKLVDFLDELCVAQDKIAGYRTLYSENDDSVAREAKVQAHQQRVVKDEIYTKIIKLFKGVSDD